MAQSSSIEVDPKLLENSDADYESSGYDTSTASLTSSVTEYIFENGRRYQAHFGADKTLMPNDEVEQDRLDMHHEIILTLLNRELHKAPIKKPHRVLDVGTGTGIWAIDMADKYPMTEVIGMDLSPIQPGWVPPNCSFQVDDAENEWTFQENSFDFIYGRNLNQSISDWPKLMSEFYRCTQPGGWVELTELGGTPLSDDGSLTDDNPCAVCFKLGCKALAMIGRGEAVGDTLRQRLETAGFVDIKVMQFKQPLGPWPKDKILKQVGTMTLLNAETAFHAYCLAAFTRILGMDKDEADRICSEGYKAVKNKNLHAYTLLHVAYGRKPKVEV